MQMENFQLLQKTNDILVFVSKEHQVKKQQLTLNYSQRRIRVELKSRRIKRSSYYKYAIY
jgi:hypothetical protein